MAGSYDHITTKKGKLRSPETFTQLIDNLGDAYEAIEEMYGMIHVLAAAAAAHWGKIIPEAVEYAQQEYKVGLDISPGIQGKGKE